MFLKIFLWFWLAMALIVGAITLVNWSTRTAPLARQFETFMRERINSSSQTAVQIYENEGIEGLDEYFQRRTNQRRVNSIGFFDEKRNLIAGDLKVAEINDLFDSALETDEPQLKVFNDRRYGAKRVVLEDGKTYVYVVEINRFRPPAFFTSRVLLQLLSVLVIGGLFCYFLARYLTQPLTKLSDATRKIADGNFETRVADQIGNRKDELTLLAHDFDRMSERIEALINSEKRLTQDISHELRSPLARMNVALELARQKANEETLPMLTRLEGESGTLNDLISKLLTLSKLETGTKSFEKMEVNIGKLAEQIVEDANFEAKAASKSVEILKTEDVRVFGNEHLLRSAIENVLRNAVRYTKDETAVQMTIEKLDSEVLLKIQDHGAGVPADELDKLFRPFYRVEAARDRKSGGVGLGLAIAERAVSSHNGEISATNTEDGLLVEIKLPAVPG